MRDPTGLANHAVRADFGRIGCSPACRTKADASKKIDELQDKTGRGQADDSG